MAVFQRFFHVAFSRTALLVMLLLAVWPGGHDLLPAVRPTLLKGRLAWIAVTTASR